MSQIYKRVGFLTEGRKTMGWHFGKSAQERLKVTGMTVLVCAADCVTGRRVTGLGNGSSLCGFGIMNAIWWRVGFSE
mgnify:CR=1 FL=1|jgi:hypothetical protein